METDVYTDIFEELIDHALMLLFRQVRPSREYDVTAARALIQRTVASAKREVVSDLRAEPSEWR